MRSLPYPTTDGYFYPPSMKAGTYAMQWSGKANIGVTGTGVTITNDVYNSTTNISTATMTLSQNQTMFTNFGAGG